MLLSIVHLSTILAFLRFIAGHKHTQWGVLIMATASGLLITTVGIFITQLRLLRTLPISWIFPSVASYDIHGERGNCAFQDRHHTSLYACFHIFKSLTYIKRSIYQQYRHRYEGVVAAVQNKNTLSILLNTCIKLRVHVD